MTSVVAQTYLPALTLLLNGGVNVSTDTLKVLLLTSSYTPNLTTHSTKADVASFEVATANGYTQGGLALVNKTVTLDTAIQDVTLHADNLVWTATGTIAFRYAVLLKDTGDNTSPLLALWDFGAQSIAAADTITLDLSSGAFRLVTWSSTIKPVGSSDAPASPYLWDGAAAWRLYCDANGNVLTESVTGVGQPPYSVYVTDTNSSYRQLTINSSGVLAAGAVVDVTTTGQQDRRYLSITVSGKPCGLFLQSTDQTKRYALRIDGTTAAISTVLASS